MAGRVSLFGRARYFLRSYIVHGRVRVILQYLFAKFQSLFIQPTILPYFITFFPYKRSSYSYCVPKAKPARVAGQLRLPNPPEHLWLGYGRTIDEWLESGQRHVTKMRELLAASGYEFKAGDRVLEMGCAAGRMLRCLEDVAERCEIWGTDISGEHILWCKQNLSPPFRFFITTTTPHLPFPDSYFDVIYAGSVFTHIDDMADTWLLELRRIMKPGGRAYITIHDNHTIRILSEQRDLSLSKTLFCRQDYFKNNDYGMFTIGRFMRSQVFFDTEYFTNLMQPFFEVRSITPEAYGFQTAVLLQNR
ncbi:MAG TPA: methyltransferase domain-containing protein [Lacipirellulaceae bacterium]|jgi:ubiquinone/menaquinone biosynthesis C-methylase UbiE